jgi:hypothetical protein
MVVSAIKRRNKSKYDKYKNYDFLINFVNCIYPLYVSWHIVKMTISEKIEKVTL